MLRLIASSLLLLFITATYAAAEAVSVKIVPGTGITRGGEPYFVKGAAGDKHLDELVATGGNSIRTWTTNGLGPILDAAQQRGLTVCAGIWRCSNKQDGPHRWYDGFFQQATWLGPASDSIAWRPTWYSVLHSGASL